MTSRATFATTQGERWTQSELARLRAAKLAPAAVAEFLRASQSRARVTRRGRPELARQELRWAAIGAAAWLLLAVLGAEPFRRYALRGLLSWSGTIAILDRHLGMVETLDGRARMLGPADAATLARAWLAPAVAGDPTPALCALGFATDALDGRLARACEPTRLGREFDRIVDAAFVAAVLRGARRKGFLSQAAMVAESARLVLGTALAAVSYFGRGHAPDRRLLEAGRASAPLRAAGFVAVAGRRNEIGTTLLVSASALKLVAGLRALGARPRQTFEPISAREPRRAMSGRSD